MDPCPLEEIVSLACWNAHPAWRHVDDDLNNILKTAKSTKLGGKICWLIESRAGLRNILTGNKNIIANIPQTHD